MLTGGCNRFLGVADLASIRFSLPAQLLEPIPNLGTAIPQQERIGQKANSHARVLALYG